MPKEDFVLRKEVDYFFKNVAMGLIEGVLLFNEKEQCIFLNQAASLMLGSEMLNRKMRSLFPEQLFEKTPKKMDVEMKSRRGNKFMASCFAYFFKMEKKKWCMVLFYNKTENCERRKYVEQVANDFGNKLAGIIGSADLLLSKFGNGSFEKNRLNNIKCLAEEASDLLIRLLEFLPREN